MIAQQNYKHFLILKKKMLKKKKRQKLNNTNFILFTFKSSYFQDLSKFMNILSSTIFSNKLNKKAF